MRCEQAQKTPSSAGSRPMLAISVLSPTLAETGFPSIGGDSLYEIGALLAGPRPQTTSQVLLLPGEVAARRYYARSSRRRCGLVTPSHGRPADCRATPAVVRPACAVAMSCWCRAGGKGTRPWIRDESVGTKARTTLPARGDHPSA